MDENKRVKLHEVEYEISAVCGICKHSTFLPGRAFGKCEKLAYEHLKHTDKKRHLSIHRFGSCNNFEVVDERNLVALFGTFREFFQT